MQRFIVGHATHPDWRTALALAAAQVEGQRARAEAADASLGFVYFSDHYAPHAQALLDALRQRWPGVAWVGTVGVGVAASGVEYFDEPALALMLAALPRGCFQVFSGARPLAAFAADTALVHADGSTPDLADLIDDMSRRTTSGYVFGGLAASRTVNCQIADGVWQGGLSGVAFSREVALVSRVTQGCQPVGPARRISACERNVVTRLDDEPALACLLRDLALTLDDPAQAIATLRGTLVGLGPPHDAPPSRGGPIGAQAGSSGYLRAPPSAVRPWGGPAGSSGDLRAPPSGVRPWGGPAGSRAFGEDIRVRHLIGLDRDRQGIAVADVVEAGMQLVFCQRDVQAARRDLVRICAEILDELIPEPLATLPATPDQACEDGAPADPLAHIAGAIYVSCAGRGGPHFGAPSAELQIVQHALGDVPLVGFFAGGEIGHHHLYGYTGVLTVFTREA